MSDHTKLPPKNVRKGRNARKSETSATRSVKSAGARHSASQGGVASYLMNHRKVAKESVTRLFQQPVTSAMTWGVLGIALALPVILAILLLNAQSVSSAWQSADQISLFLHSRVNDERVLALAHELNTRSSVRHTEIKWRDDALDAFRAQPGFADVVNFLDSNPLPHVIVVYPATATEGQSYSLESLMADLSGLKEVDKVQLDMAWVQRLRAITDLIERAVWTLSILLAFAVLLVIGNTTRLAIENRRQEIVVMKLVGGTDAFVKRPFLYTGVWFGMGGALVALVLVQLVLNWIELPIQELALSYGSDFRLMGMGFDGSLTVIVISMLLGWLGAWISVRRHLDAIEPK